MQQKSAAIAAARDAQAFMAHVQYLLPLIQRAESLGIDIHEPWPGGVVETARPG
jgi:hypothetical protein